MEVAVIRGQRLTGNRTFQPTLPRMGETWPFRVALNLTALGSSVAQISRAILRLHWATD